MGQNKETSFQMVDIFRKRPTARKAIARGSLNFSEIIYHKIKNNTIAKGNPIELAEIAGILAAKKTADLIPLCHNLNLDQVKVNCLINEQNKNIEVYAQVSAFAKTGVEMEALVAVNAALLTIWDLAKSVDTELKITNIELLLKTGGKQGIWLNKNCQIPNWIRQQLPNYQLKNKKIALVTMSDRAYSGDYQDLTSPLLEKLIKQSSAKLVHKTLIADDKQTIIDTLKQNCDHYQADLLIAAGGTGPGPRDVTPEAMEVICQRMLDGLGDYLRQESLYFTDTAWLSRMAAGMCGKTLIIALPGSPKAVEECWHILLPVLNDALEKIKKQGFETLK